MSLNSKNTLMLDECYNKMNSSKLEIIWEKKRLVAVEDEAV